ncbi:SixA phosphatase family protein [Mucilaginibacter terrae]|uniref:Phosphohistidine phosphatase n=1 Tax=Mucilaginibacter terrae TaxID=1955052 RepID=A0ABU3GZ52_9SPHI|nr:histidine phosphatase family protein [Mucilaginibacter terrae]MDT3405046.1 phosphohistidine phosphatase [Mucilaginibacter terrae]
MKKLLLVRHAKAEEFAAGGDFHRPLSVKGENDVKQLAQKLQAEKLVPEQIICSSALRTQTTADILSISLNIPQPRATVAIYEASERTLLREINHFSNAYDFVAMVGHNPGIAYLLLNLTGKVRDVPTCAAIVLVFEDADSWQEITHESGVITWYSVPQ